MMRAIREGQKTPRSPRIPRKAPLTWANDPRKIVSIPRSRKSYPSHPSQSICEGCEG